MDEDSSDGDTHSTHPDSAGPKRRRLHGACDICRRKKIKCNSAQMPGNICSNCIAANLECTHDTPRHPKKDSQKGYIRVLEERLDKMEQMLRNIRPDGDPSSPESIAGSSGTTHTQGSSSSFPDVKFPAVQSLPDSQTVASNSSLKSEDDSEDSEDLAHVGLSAHLKNLSLQMAEDRFFGQSSSFMLIKHATNVKSEYTGREEPIGRNFGRPTYWDFRSWERAYAESQPLNFVYPERDLLDSLVALYFSEVHPFIPILHRPLFERSVANGLHLWDSGFGMTLLSVCALGSRFSNDPRVFLQDDETGGLSCGWKYFSQIPLLRNKILMKTTVYDLQYYCLAIIFLLGTSMPHLAWNILGVGIRIAQERGVHRRRGDSFKPTLEDELWKRGFWCLVLVDRMMSSFLGRPCAVQDEDFDVEYPIECDDEYWESGDSDVPSAQPEGKPCIMTGFNCQLKLCEMLAFALRTLYSTKKSKILAGLIGDQWEQRIVAELDSAMNKWRDSLPDHLRWDPSREDRTFVLQSAALHISFYYLQIQVHRPFLQKKSPLSFPSLAICTHAARSSSHVLASAQKKGVLPHFPHITIATFASGIVLLLNVWGGRRAGLATDPNNEMANVQKCLDVLKEYEIRWLLAGRLWDMLNELKSMGNASLPAYEPSKNKRSRGPETYVPSAIEPRSPAHAPAVAGVTGSGHIERAFFGIAPNPPPSQQAQAQVLPESLTNSQFNAPFSAGNNWDLSNLLLNQMGYAQQDVSTNLPSETIIPTPVDSFMQRNQQFYLRTESVGSSDKSHLMQPAFPSATVPLIQSANLPPIQNMDDQMMSLWSGAPDGFNIEDWDTYVANMEEISSMLGGSLQDIPVGN